MGLQLYGAIDGDGWAPWFSDTALARAANQAVFIKFSTVFYGVESCHPPRSRPRLGSSPARVRCRRSPRTTACITASDSHYVARWLRN